jgi:FKBP-type peptidyl-prolyl cis-trans isomerase
VGRALAIALFSAAALGCVRERVTPETLPEPLEHPSGLIVEDLHVGAGPFCQPNDVVTVEYVGRLEDGSVFVATRDTEGFRGRGGAHELSLADAMAGWREGLPGMRVGGRRRLVIPPDLAYGELGRPPRIPPNATLLFEIVLVDTRRGALR